MALGGCLAVSALGAHGWLWALYTGAPDRHVLALFLGTAVWLLAALGVALAVP